MEVAVARRFVSDALRRWDAAGQRETAVLLVSELVSNAVVHAHTEIALTLRYDRGLITVGVRDGSDQLPARSDVPPAATSGRGLQMVDALAVDWGVLRVPEGGKVIWFALGSMPSGPEDHPLGRAASGNSPSSRRGGCVAGEAPVEKVAVERKIDGA